MNTDCLADFDVCEGTDAICSRIENPVFRGWCFESHTKAPYLEPFHEGCLGAGRQDDERCIGTEAFCQAPQMISSYGSNRACLDHREGPPSSSKSSEQKMHFLEENPLRCYGDATEECLGTEKYCGNLEAKERQQCFDSHQRRPYSTVYATECGSRATNAWQEACVGTLEWCSGEDRIRLYGSKEDCLKLRTAPPQISKWLPPADGCLDRGSNATEACQGTETVCNTYTTERDACFAAREPAPFLLPNSIGCPDPTLEEERCLGTDAWCHEKHALANYMDEQECFSRRGLDQAKLAARVADSFKGPVKRAILHSGEAVTKHAVIRDLFAHGGDASSLMKEVKTDLAAYADALEDAMERAAEEHVDNVLTR